MGVSLCLAMSTLTETGTSRLLSKYFSIFVVNMRVNATKYFVNEESKQKMTKTTSDDNEMIDKRMKRKEKTKKNRNRTKECSEDEMCWNSLLFSDVQMFEHLLFQNHLDEMDLVWRIPDV